MTNHNPTLVYRTKVVILLSLNLKRSAMYGKPMKPYAVVTPRDGVRFVAVLLMCCATLVHISAMDETPEGIREGKVQNYERVSADGAEAAGKESLLHRERRAVKNIAELEKRLQAMAERYALS